jgi:alkylation response protein AidB-like acyl-CoA dehydrogenase
LGIAISEEHQELSRVATAFLEAQQARAAARALLDAREEALPDFWKELVGLGWTGLHLPEAHGGAGFGLPELAVVTEALGRFVAPGPFLSTVISSAVIAAHGSPAQQAAWLRSFADGSTVGAIGLGGALSRSRDGRLDGSVGLVLSAGLANLLLLRVGDDLALVETDRPGVTIEPRRNLDPTRRVSLVRCESVELDDAAILPGGFRPARRMARALAAAEACGAASACVEMAVEYAKLRKQFGRVIGSFQAVKHHCANMLVTAELATAAAWDAARNEPDDEQAELSSAVAAATALPALDRCAKLNIQVHGGIGYTWEHDAHLYLRRAAALAAAFGPVDQAEENVAQLLTRGVRRDLALELPPEAEQYRAQARAFVSQYQRLAPAEARAALVEAGYLMPHWPRPWGRGAGAVEQLVIEQEFAGIKRPNLGIGGWIAATLLQHGTPEQIDRWVQPSLDGELQWCQLFSEPGAGSDAAAIQTRGTRVEGGWQVTGQKVWTSGAQVADRGLATIRTDPDARKHEGITAVVIDMQAPGVDVRPLREITGHAMFNEVFLGDVFVPDHDVVGEVNQGWRVARSTLGNERVTIGGDKHGYAPDLAGLLARRAPDDPGVWREAGALLGEGQALRLINLRQVARAVAGGEPGPEGNVSKLLSSEHAQRVGELCMRLLQDEAALLEGEDAAITTAHLFLRCLTIGGGTSEIVRNQIAERLLGLPRDPA